MSTKNPITINRPRKCPECKKKGIIFVAWSLEQDNTKICHDCRVAEEKRVYR